MQRYFGQARDAAGNVLSGVQVAVYTSGTSTLATLYNGSDPNDTPASTISNPITTGSNGVFGFAAANGDYDIVISGSSFGTLTYPRVNLFDGSSTSAVTAAGSSNQIQYNSAGALAASANFTFNPSTNKLIIGGTGTPFAFANAKALGYDTLNSYLEFDIQNLSNGASASADMTVTADTGSDTTGFTSMGVNSSAFNDGTWTVNGALDGYLYNAGGHLAVGTSTAGKNLYLFTGGTLLANRRVTVDGTTGLVTFANSINLGQQNLSNYSEGTWTPTMGGSTVFGTQTYATQVGRYTRIGRLVHITCRVVLASTSGATGSIIIGGLPFTSSSSLASRAGATAVQFFNFTGYTTSTKMSGTHIPGGVSYVLPCDENFNAIPTTALLNNSFIDISATYEV